VSRPAQERDIEARPVARSEPTLDDVQADGLDRALEPRHLRRPEAEPSGGLAQKREHGSQIITLGRHVDACDLSLCG